MLWHLFCYKCSQDFLPIRDRKRTYHSKINTKTIILLGRKSYQEDIEGGKMKKLTATIIVLGTLITASLRNASLVSEPVNMILLGGALIGLAVFGRRLFFRKS